MRAGFPACICQDCDWLLYSHTVSFPSSIALCASDPVCGGTRTAGVPSAEECTLRQCGSGTGWRPDIIVFTSGGGCFQCDSWLWVRPVVVRRNGLGSIYRLFHTCCETIGVLCGWFRPSLSSGRIPQANCQAPVRLCLGVRSFVGQLRQYAVASLLAYVTVRGVHRILFNDCAKHWYINCGFQADLRSFAAPCSGASKPRLASSASAGNSGCSLRGNASLWWQA